VDFVHSLLRSSTLRNCRSVASVDYRLTRNGRWLPLAVLTSEGDYTAGHDHCEQQNFTRSCHEGRGLHELQALRNVIVSLSNIITQLAFLLRFESKPQLFVEVTSVGKSTSC
jgi:hypothetical protein